MKSDKKALKVTVHLSPATVDEMEMKDKNVVVVDVLRASTTIAALLQNEGDLEPKKFPPDFSVY